MNSEICRNLLRFFAVVALLIFDFQLQALAQQVVLTAQSAVSGFQPVNMMSSVFSMLKGLAICIGILFLVIWLLRKFKAPIITGQGRRLRIVERLPVSARSSVLLLEVNQKQVLIGVGSDPVNLISDFVEADSLQVLDKAAGTDDKK